MIILKEITSKNIWKVCELEPFEDQKDFVAKTYRALQKPMQREMRAIMPYP